MMIRALTLAAGLAAASTANAAFLGVDFVVDDQATADARTLGGDLADATVYQMVAAWDNDGNRLNNVFNVNFQLSSSGSLFQQDLFGTDKNNGPQSSDSFGFEPKLEFDTFVTMNGGDVQFDGNGFISRSSQGLSGAGLTGNSGWFTTPGTFLGNPIQGNEAVAGLSSAIDLSSAYTVWLGQFTVVGASARDVLQGSVSLNFNAGVGPDNLGGTEFAGTASELTGLDSDFVPTPGALSLFGLAGLTAARRRRA